MAAKFFKRGTIDFTANPSPTYPDLYDNNKTTAQISSGSFDTNSDGIADKSNTSLFIADLPVPARPSFGSAELTGLKFGFYLNSIKIGDNQTVPGIKAFKLDTKIGNNEGGKSSATGTLISDEDIVQFSSYHSKTGITTGTDFSNSNIKSKFTTAQTGFTTLGSDPYLPRRIGYDEGRRFGARDAKAMSRNEHFKRFGTTIGDTNVEGYPITKLIAGSLIQAIDSADGDDYFSAIEYPRWGHYNHEYWPSDDPKINAAVRYGVEVPLTGTIEQATLKEGGFFDIVCTDEEFYDMGIDTDQILSEPRRVAYNVHYVSRWF